MGTHVMMAHQRRGTDIEVGPGILYVPTTQCSCRTRVEVWKCSHRWTIENFLYCPRRTGQSLESPCFFSGPKGELKWRLVLYPKGVSEEYFDYVSLYLKFLPSSRITTQAAFEVSIINESGRKSWSFFRDGYFIPHSSIGWEKFMKRDVFLKSNLKILESNEIIIQCDISASSDVTNLTEKDKNSRFLMPMYHVQEQYMKLLESGRLSDVTLTTKNEEFRAHSAVLAANSPKFLAMFGDPEGKGKIRVNMMDFDTEVVREMLRFMYGARVPNFRGKMAEELLAAADWFGVTALKEVCENVLASKVAIKTAAHYLQLADACNAGILKTFCLEFIRKNVADVLDTAEWKAIAAQRPNVADDLASALAVHLMTPVPEPT